MPDDRADQVLLQVDDVVKNFGGVTAVDHCSFHVRSGTITGLMGPNGAGKTTLCDLISGLQRLDAGRIHLAGKRLHGLTPPRVFSRQIARTFQHACELPHLTVLEQLLLVPESQYGERLWDAWLRRRRVQYQEQALLQHAEEILWRVKLHRVRHEYAANLSAAQRKILALARVMMSNATLVLLDEPSAGLDPAMRRDLLDYVQDMREAGRTLLVIEQEMNPLMEICDSIIVMSNGRRLMEGTASQVRVHPHVLAAYLGE